MGAWPELTDNPTLRHRNAIGPHLRNGLETATTVKICMHLDFPKQRPHSHSYSGYASRQAEGDGPEMSVRHTRINGDSLASCSPLWLFFLRGTRPFAISGVGWMPWVLLAMDGLVQKTAFPLSRSAFSLDPRFQSFLFFCLVLLACSIHSFT